jgi:hypothetical protein
MEKVTIQADPIKIPRQRFDDPQTIRRVAHLYVYGKAAHMR